MGQFMYRDQKHINSSVGTNHKNSIIFPINGRVNVFKNLKWLVWYNVHIKFTQNPSSVVEFYCGQTYDFPYIPIVWKMKEEALDRTLWRTRFGRGYGPVIRQTTE
jgi:hypothetical protein